MDNVRIAVEGMDGVGKTTIAKMVAKDFDMKFIEKPLKRLFNIPELNGSDNLSSISNNIYSLNSEIIKACFFGMGNIYSILENADQDLIIDRHFASNYFWNGSSKTDCVFSTMIDLVGKPDITILLHASVETRLERIYKRDKNDYDLLDKEKHVYGYDKMIDFLNRFDLPYIVVDTENKSIDEVYKEVSNIVNNVKQSKISKKLVK